MSAGRSGRSLIYCFTIISLVHLVANTETNVMLNTQYSKAKATWNCAPNQLFVRDRNAWMLQLSRALITKTERYAFQSPSVVQNTSYYSSTYWKSLPTLDNSWCITEMIPGKKKVWQQSQSQRLSRERVHLRDEVCLAKQGERSINLHRCIRSRSWASWKL